MTLPARIWRKIRPHFSTFVSFNVIQGTQLILPMLILPWLARALGAEAYGLCLYMGIVSGIVGMVMDWGFALGATRDVAVNRGQEQIQGEILASVLSAKALLAVGCALACFVLSPFVPHALAYPGAYSLAILAGISRGINPVWFFQGLGRGIQSMAVWDAVSGALVLSLTIALVGEAEDWPVYLLLLALVKGGVYLGLTLRQIRQYPRFPFSVGRGWAALARHKTLFVGNLAGLISEKGSQLVLGHFLTPAQMGMLVTADKIVRAAVSLSQPLMRTLFPEICAMRQAMLAQTTRLLRLAFFGATIVMTLGAAALWWISPWLIDAVLGAAYADVVPALRIMCFIIPLQTCNDVLGGQVLVPFGQERAQTLVKAVLAVLSLPAAAALGYFFGLEGGACLPLLLQGCMLLGLSWYVLRVCPDFLCNR